MKKAEIFQFPTKFRSFFLTLKKKKEELYSFVRKMLEKHLFELTLRKQQPLFFLSFRVKQPLFQWAGQDSNLRPHPCKGCALTN